MPDARIEDQGTIILLHPLTPAAENWVNMNCYNGFQPYWPIVVIERRYIDDIVAGLRRDGLEVEV